MLSLGFSVISWIEHYLVHGPGDVQGEPVTLDDEIAAFVLRCYSQDAAGRRLFDECLLSRPKGRAKTELAAFLVCAEALGPVRFSHFAERGEISDWGYEFEPGEPVGRPITYPFIRCLATEEDQSGNTYGAAAFMLSSASESKAYDEWSVDLGRDWQSSTRIFLPGGGEVRPSTAASASKDGGKETFAVADEPHLYVLPENRRMYDVVFRNMAKRKSAAPWMLSTSTMFAPGEQSTAELLHDDAKVNGRLLLDHREARRHVALDDDAGLLAELEYVYGDGWPWMDQARLLVNLRNPRQDEADRRRYFLNEPWKGSTAWVDARDWAACTAADVVVADRERIALGFDGSRVEDSTALIGCRVSDGHLFVVEMWEKPAGRSNWEVDAESVHAAVRMAFTRWDVRAMFADPWQWFDELGVWEREHGRVFEFKTNHATKMAEALDRMAGAIRAHTVTHDGDSRLAAHVANAHKRTRGELTVISKEHKRSEKKIDAAVAATLAYSARASALDEVPEPAGRVYSFR